MKRIFTILIVMVYTFSVYAQGDVTTFLGIPVDGFKADMRKQLISKGFTPKQVQNNEFFEGEFNGADVQVFIATNNNKVCRIMLADANYQNEANIKIRFNRLVSQFENNKRYTTLNNYTIPDDEDISYEMLVHNKVYDAIFYQTPDIDKVDSVYVQNQMREEMIKRYTLEQLQNPNEELIKEMQEFVGNLGIDMLLKKPVWFRICELHGEYYITMYYDNEYNRANGEDL